MALHKYGFPVGEGLYTDMNAIRREEEMDNTHSIYVDQWDWELVISENQRNEGFLRKTVQKITDSICGTHMALQARFPQLTAKLTNDIFFITAQELEDMYPNLNEKQKEEAIVKQHKTVFISQIGGSLKSGRPHGSRAPDYDDWRLNGDLIIWHDTLGIAMEITSMGIRVDANSLDAQLRIADCGNRRELTFHKMLLENKLPLTMGGGLGQSRLCMLWLEKAHIGEVQASVWDADTLAGCKQIGINIL
jgi:aspartate--ammonia ligase